MIAPDHCIAVIPCFNEGATVAQVVTGVRPFVSAVLVVDDGSTDGTGQKAIQAGAMVLRHESSQGKGAALVSGWTRARELGFEWALSLDGDGQHAPADAPKFLKAACDSGARLVVGNRMTGKSVMPWMRRRVNEWMSRRLSRLAGVTLPDTQCGYRLIHLGTWSTLATSTRHFEIESEVLLEFIRAGHPVEFVPIQVIYKSEQSKIHPLHDTLRWFRWWRRVQKDRR